MADKAQGGEDFGDEDYVEEDHQQKDGNAQYHYPDDISGDVPDYDEMDRQQQLGDMGDSDYHANYDEEDDW